MILNLNSTVMGEIDHIFIDTFNSTIKITNSHSSICGFGEIIYNNKKYIGFFDFNDDKILNFTES